MPADGNTIVDAPVRLNRHPDGSKDRPFWRKDSETLSRVLADMALHIRYNTRAHRVEWREERQTDSDAWEAATDRALADLRERIGRQYYVSAGEGQPAKPLKWGRDAFHDTMNALLHHREVDPFAEWLRDLPAWDGNRRLDKMLLQFGAPDDGLTRWASRYLYLGPVQRTLDPGCKIDEIPVLIGDQGIGKSTFVAAGLPPEHPEWFGDGLSWSDRIREQVESTLGRVIVEVSEMAGRRKAEIEHLKAFISRRDDGHVRLAYARNPESMPRRFVLVCTTNNPNDLPNDPSGNRRLVPILLTKGLDVERAMNASRLREQLWAEAMRLYHSGQVANLPRELQGLAAERAERHRDRDDLLEDAIEQLPPGTYKVRQIMDLLGDVAKGIHPRRMADALRNAGWKQHRLKTARLWEKG